MINVSSDTAGPLYPAPTSLSHKSLGPTFGQLLIRFFSPEMPLRSGPKNCGQSEALEGAFPSKRRHVDISKASLTGQFMSFFLKRKFAWRVANLPDNPTQNDW